jgi:hypothetical protein
MVVKRRLQVPSRDKFLYKMVEANHKLTKLDVAVNLFVFNCASKKT